MRKSEVETVRARKQGSRTQIDKQLLRKETTLFLSPVSLFSSIF